MTSIRAHERVWRFFITRNTNSSDCFDPTIRASSAMSSFPSPVTSSCDSIFALSMTLESFIIANEREINSRWRRIQSQQQKNIYISTAEILPKHTYTHTHSDTHTDTHTHILMHTHTDTHADLYTHILTHTLTLAYFLKWVISLDDQRITPSRGSQGFWAMKWRWDQEISQSARKIKRERDR